ncbi:MAG TPA: hypothetical protein PKW50_04310 [Syntrophomonas sp.]|nr:hypothetical protein [Syntrophomonas sp.]
MTPEQKQQLFNHFLQEHDATLLDNDFNEIENILIENILKDPWQREAFEAAIRISAQYETNEDGRYHVTIDDMFNQWKEANQ